MTLTDLLEVVYHFYPRSLFVDGLGYEDTAERCRQREATRRGVAEYPTWKAMIRRLGARYPLMDRSLSLLSGSYDPGYSGYIVIPGHTLGFHVSLLGPFYGVHRTGVAGEESAALDLVRAIETTYPGHEPIPAELGNEVVPDVALDAKGFGKATVYFCLLSPEWEWSSRPHNGTRSRDYVEPPDDPGSPDEAPDLGPPEERIHVKDRRG